MYRSYSFNNMPQPINTATEGQKTQSIIKTPEKKEELPILSSLKSDDLVLLLVIVVLLFNECDDKLLLLALLYIFFSDYFNG